MIYKCRFCDSIFDENDAEINSYDIEDDLGVGSLFADHHTATCFVCPDCGSDDLEEYVEEDNRKCENCRHFRMKVDRDNEESFYCAVAPLDVDPDDFCERYVKGGEE